MDGDIFENAPRVDADVFSYERCVFKNIPIRVDEKLMPVSIAMTLNPIALKHTNGCQYSLKLTLKITYYDIII